MKHSIAIIGAGAVGSTIAYSLLLKNIVAEIVLVDINTARCAGEVKDLEDALAFSYTSSVYQGTYDDVKKADIVIIAAGKPQKPGQSRRELINDNIAILRSLLKNLKELQPHAILMIVANPLDLLTLYALDHCELPRAQIFGTGTFLDSQRLKNRLSSELSISEESIQAFVLGEHGDSQVVAWSATRIAGSSVEAFGITPEGKERLATTVKMAAYDIIQAKGATFYGIAACVTELCEIIIFNKKTVVPVSWYHEEYGVCLSLPVLLSESGIERVIDTELSAKERQELQASADILKDLKQYIHT
jgi:L-lactate dehydrogenase